MEKLNIAEILKDCPKGMELDCTIWDNVVFDHIDTTSNYPIYIKKMGGELEYLTEDGHFNFDCDAKCVIFPKGKTTWEGFQRPFKDGDILVRKSSQPFIFKKLNDGNGCYSYCGIDCGGEFRLASTDWTFADSLRFATEEEKKKLFDAIKDNGYKWNAETKTLEKLIESKFKVGDRIRHKVTNKDDVYEINSVYDDSYGLVGFTWMIDMKYQDQFELVSNKFDINTLKPFDKVLVRDNDESVWFPALYGNIRIMGGKTYYMTVNGHYKQCIPYKGNENLLGETMKCIDYYKTWG